MQQPPTGQTLHRPAARPLGLDETSGSFSSGNGWDLGHLGKGHTDFEHFGAVTAD
jgi:hypothetical protein